MVTAMRKPRHDSPITGPLAGWYARITKNRRDEFITLAENVARQLPAGSDVLEVAPGPGYWAIEVARRGYRVVGLDLSQDLVRIANENALAANISIDFRHGNADAMPLESNSFDFVFCSAAFKNFARPLAALNEMHRVLRPGAQAQIVDLRNDATPDDIVAHVESMQLGPVNAMLTRLIFKHLLLKRAYSREDFEQLASESHFRSCTIDSNSIGLSVRLRKAEIKTGQVTTPFI